MTHNAQFDRDTFIDAKRDLDNALAVIGAQLEQYLDKPGNAAALQAARSELQRLLERLKTVRLDGVVAFCAALGGVLAGLPSPPPAVSALGGEVGPHALLGLAGYLDELANGAD